MAPDAARDYRLRAIFECGKLDPQVADTPVLAPFPLVIGRAEWQRVAACAEALAREALASERELVDRPDLHHRLALPAALCRALRRYSRRGAPDQHPRVARFDFHWAADHVGGEARWQVSEVNADVPGGFIEAGALASLMLTRYRPAGVYALPPDPAEALAETLIQRAARGGATDAPGRVALVHATAFADDYQVMRRLGAAIEARGLRTHMAAPDHVSWSPDGTAVDRLSGERLIAIVRFYPAEWLPELSSPIAALAERVRRPNWHGFVGSRTLLVNPATALLVQSKRWPLLWDRLGTSLPAWRAMLPETRDPREVGRINARHPGDWVLKPAMGRVGEGILIPGLASRDERAIRRAARRHPGHWVGQRRFQSVPVESPLGPLHVCLGVYVIDGTAAGLYARACTRPLIDQGAYEIPVLIQEDA